MKIYIFIALVLIATFAVGSLGLNASTALAAADCTGGSATSEVQCGVTQANGGSTSPSLDKIATETINILSVIVGIAAVIMIVIGGFKYVTSGGDSSRVSSAKSTLTYAIVGLVVVALAQSLVHFVLNKLS